MIGRFRPLAPDRLVDALADRVVRRRSAGPIGALCIGVDGPTEIGAEALADRWADRLGALGIPVVRASTSWWWRPSALRLEWGHQDVEALLHGWVDRAALIRELIDPVRHPPRGYLTRLRDPATDRSVRQLPAAALPGTVLLLDGAFLLAARLPLDEMVTLTVTPGTLARSLPPGRQWWLPAALGYDELYQPADTADVVLSYDHPAAPAATGL